MSENSLAIFENKNGLQIKNTKIMKFKNGLLENITPVVLIDVSGSMAIQDCKNNEARINVVNRIVTKMPGLPRFSFANEVHEILFSQELIAYGHTDLRKALLAVSQKKYAKVILISDGLPDDSNSALHEALIMCIQFDTIYIGTDLNGKQFMQELSRKTGGIFSCAETSDIDFQAKIESNIARFLLEDKTKQDSGTKP